MIDWISKNTTTSTILEFGSGDIRGISKGNIIITISDNLELVSRSGDSGQISIYAPMVNGWYNWSIISRISNATTPHLIIVRSPLSRLFVQFFESIFISSYIRRVVHCRIDAVIFDTKLPDDHEVVDRFIEMTRSYDQIWEKIQNSDLSFTAINRTHIWCNKFMTS